MKLLSWKYCLYFILIVLLFSQCDKLKWNLSKVQQPKNSNHSALSLTTTNASNITKTSVTSGGTIISNGGLPVIQSGLIISVFQNPTLNNGLMVYINTNRTDSGSYDITISNLSPGSTFYLCAYAINSADTAYGNQITFTTYTHNIGDTFGGGIVFYIDGTGQHGLISSTGDQGSCMWEYGITNPGITDTGIGTGFSNTNTIVSNLGCGHSIAACITRAYSGGGYNDWFLPSRNELLLMQNEKDLIGGFSITSYWSSSAEWDNIGYTYAQSVYFATGGGAIGNSASNIYNVRAIRSF